MGTTGKLTATTTKKRPSDGNASAHQLRHISRLSSESMFTEALTTRRFVEKMLPARWFGFACLLRGIPPSLSSCQSPFRLTGWVGGLAWDEFCFLHWSMFLRSNHSKTSSKHVASTMVLVLYACSMSLSSRHFFLSITIRVAHSGGVGVVWPKTCRRRVFFFKLCLFVWFEIDVQTCEI